MHKPLSGGFHARPGVLAMAVTVGIAMVYLLGRGATERRPVPIAASAAPLAAGPAVLPLPLGNHTIRAQAPVDPVQFSAASKSQIGDEVWLFNNVFFNITAGFYLEMGGSDGVSNSNTRAFAQAANWRGMLIEADPDAYPKMVANRPDALCVHAAVCDDFKVVHHLRRGEVGGIYEFMSPGFKAFLTEWNLGIKEEDVASLPTVACVPMMWLLQRFGVSEISLWSLDVEEAELQVLQTVDFSKLRVKSIIVEAAGRSPDKDAAVQKLLESNGFELYHVNDFNQIYLHQTFKDGVSKNPALPADKPASV